MQVACVVAGLALADTAALGELPEPVIAGIGVENDGMDVERIGGPGVGGLVDSDMSPRVLIATALRRSTKISSQPLKGILKVGRGRRTKVDVDGVPDHIIEIRYKMMSWRYVWAEVVGCG